MTISRYSFGHITVDGVEYTSDIIIFPDGRVRDSWWRQSGHSLCLADITDLLDSAPEVIVCGTGSPGLMKPAAEISQALSARGIEFDVAPSKEAVGLYNELAEGPLKVGACFHLTC